MTFDPSNAVVTITGGTGSFGQTMARHLLAKNVAELRIFSRDEAKQDKMRGALDDSRVKFYLGDTRDEESVRQVVRGSTHVFHAAAMKQVPSAEFFPMEAVKTNIVGSRNVISAAIDSGVESVVCLSTDKAVYPINAMGMTKALMEKTAQSFARDAKNANTRISVTRYGNVMFSRGSVIPLFLAQLANGSPLTITEGSMTRFLMSLRESVDLVEHAFQDGESGDIFVRKAPAASIENLARAISDLQGKQFSFQKIGIRHGEKLFETLLSAEERAKAEDQGDYFRVPLDARDLNYGQYFEEGSKISKSLEPYTSHNTRQLSQAEIRALLTSNESWSDGSPDV